MIVRDVMTRRPVTVSPDATLAEVAALMARHHIRRVPVIAHRRLAGIVARSDLLRALHAAMTRSRATLSRSDAEIDAAVKAAIVEVGLFPAGQITVAVAGGDVTLHGTLTGERHRAALRAAAEAVPGVRRVRDGLASVDPPADHAPPLADHGPGLGVRA